MFAHLHFPVIVFLQSKSYHREKQSYHALRRGAHYGLIPPITIARLIVNTPKYTLLHADSTSRQERYQSRGGGGEDHVGDEHRGIAVLRESVGVKEGQHMYEKYMYISFNTARWTKYHHVFNITVIQRRYSRCMDVCTMWLLHPHERHSVIIASSWTYPFKSQCYNRNSITNSGCDMTYFLQPRSGTDSSALRANHSHWWWCLCARVCHIVVCNTADWIYAFNSIRTK